MLMRHLFVFLCGVGCGMLVYLAITAGDQQPAKPGCACADCDCAKGVEANGVLPIVELPAEAMEVKSLGNGWVKFQLDLNGYRRVFVYRRGSGLAELQHSSKYIGGKGEIPEKPVVPPGSSKPGD